MVHVLKQLLWVLVCIVSVSCTQDPLQNISKSLRNGIYSTGDSNQGIFNHSFFSSDIIRMSFLGKTKFTLQFKEDVESTYVVKLQALTSDFPFDIAVKFQDSLFHGTDSGKFQAAYNKKKKEITLTWSPSDNFTKYEVFKEVNLPIQLELINKDDLNQPLLVINKKIKLRVKKTYKVSEIFKFVYDNKVFEKLKDGNFYEMPRENQKIDLRLGRKVYRKDKKDKKDNPLVDTSDAEELSLAEQYTFVEISPSSNPDAQGPFVDTKIIIDGIDSLQIKPIDIKEVYPRLEKPIYEKRVGAKACASSENSQTIDGQVICYFEVEGSIAYLNKDAYESYYTLPEKITYQDDGQKDLLFDSKVKGIYKFLESVQACHPRIRGKEYLNLPEDKGKKCYVQVLSGDNFFSPEQKFYYFPASKNRKKSYRLSDGQLQKNYRVIPDYIKLLLAGYNPIVLSNSSREDFKLLFYDNDRSLSLDVYVRDTNYLTQGPTLDLIKLGDVVSPLTVELINKDSTGFNREIFVFKYKISDIRNMKLKIYQNKYFKTDFAHDTLNEFYNIQINFQLFIKGINDFNISSIPVVFYMNPKVQTFYTSLDDVKTMKVSQEVIEKQIEGEVVRQVSKTFLNLSHKIKVDYLFPLDSFKTFLKIIPKKVDLVELPEKIAVVNLLDLLKVEKLFYNHSTDDVYCIKDNLFTEESSYQGLFQSSCSCDLNQVSEDTEIRKEILTSNCKYEVQLNLNKDHTKPFYANYQYGFSKSVVEFRTDIFRAYTPDLYLLHYLVDQEKEISEAEVSFPDEVEKNKLVFGSRHFFFNLKPVSTCKSTASSETKECTIQYPYQNFIGFSNIVNTEEELKDMFSIDVTCLDGLGEKTACSCEEQVTIVQDELNNKGSISKTCVINKNAQGAFTASLRTHNEDIYFINIQEEIDTTKASNKGAFKKTQTDTLSY